MKALKFGTLALTFAIVSCQTPQPSAPIAEDLCGSSRDPASAAQCSKVFTEVKKEIPPLDTSPEKLMTYAQFNKKLKWQSYIETDVDFMSFYSRRSFERGQESKHKTEIWGFENYKAYVQGRDYLNQIAVGDFKLTRNLILKLHELGADGIKKQSWMMAKLMPKNMSTGNSTGFKARTNVGEDPLFNPLTEVQYNNLKANPWISGFRELPWPFSRPNKRRGLIIYGSHKKVEQSLSDLIQWYEKNSATMDPVALAAEFQYRFVSIHPFIDGNGRTSLLLANRILMEHGYPGIIHNFPGYDIYYSVKDWTEIIRTAVSEYAEVAKGIRMSGVAPSINKVNNVNTRTNLTPDFSRKLPLEKLNKINRALKEKYGLYNIITMDNLAKIGNREFAFLQDGFFYDFNGIPYALFGKKLYPVTDRTYLLYAENGPVKDRRFTRRGLTPAHSDLFRSHFELISQLRAGELKPKDIEIIDYSVIAKANEAGEIYLFPWQVSLFENAITIKDTDPFAVLAHTRGSHTHFEVAFENKSTSVSAAEVIAQYQFLEIKYQRYMEVAEKMANQQWKDLIMESRNKYFIAAKTLLDKALRQQAQLPVYENKIVKESARWALMAKYLQHTNLAYPTLKEAIAARGDKNIVLMRSDLSSAEKVGFISNSAYLEIAKLFPGFEKFKSWVKQYAEANDKEQREKLFNGPLTKHLKTVIPGFEKLMERINQAINTNVYDKRAVSETSDREFVNHQLHAHDSPLKDHISLSTSTDLYFGWMGDGTKKSAPFLKEGTDGKLFFVMMDKSKVANTIATPYEGEYETLSRSYIGPQRIIDSLGVEFFSMPDAKEWQTINEITYKVIEVPTGEK